MERHVEYAGYKFNMPSARDMENTYVGPMTAFFIARSECKAICTQGRDLVVELKNDLEKIPQTELSCRSVINITYKSEIFQVFTHISKYNMEEYWNEDFAQEMAHEVSKSMDVDYITASESNTRLFCMLSCIPFAAIDVTISDIDMTKISSDILRFIYTDPNSGWPGREVVITNLSDPENRTTSAKFVNAPTFETDEAILNGQLA
jgi:hypothetical protein